jgi:Ran GTPase-activating protein 1
VLSAEGEVPTLIEALAKGRNPKLRTLQLQNNNLETATFGVLAASISQGLSSLLRLELQWNEVEEENEHLENIGLALKQRGGKLYVDDEDEEEEQEAREHEEEKEAEIEEQLHAAEAPKAVNGEKVKDSADELADLLGKVTIKE